MHEIHTQADLQQRHCTCRRERMIRLRCSRSASVKLDAASSVSFREAALPCTPVVLMWLRRCSISARNRTLTTNAVPASPARTVGFDAKVAPTSVRRRRVECCHSVAVLEQR